MITAAVMQKPRYAISHDLLPTAREWQHPKLYDKTLLKVCNNWCFSVLYYYYLPPAAICSSVQMDAAKHWVVGGPRIAVGEDNNKLLLCRAVAAVDAAMPGDGVTGHDAMITRSKDQDISLSGRRAGRLPAASYRDGDRDGWGASFVVDQVTTYSSSRGINHSIFHGDPITDNWTWK